MGRDKESGWLMGENVNCNWLIIIVLWKSAKKMLYIKKIYVSLHRQIISKVGADVASLCIVIN